MFFDYKFDTAFTLFAFSLIKVLCDVDYQNIANERGDLTNLNMSVYCKFQPNGVVCSTRKISHKYFFDVKLKRCELFEYGHCNHSYNMFDGKRTCQTTCQDDAYEAFAESYTDIVYCRFQPAFGDCNSYHPSWYYDITDMTCKSFSYSGCGGNRNRFSTAHECLDVCRTAIAFNG